jgi:8-oxo-dGTP diphosphatase
MASLKRTVQHQTYVYVDLVCLTLKDREPKIRDRPTKELFVLTVERQTAKKGMLALPGGLLEDSEDLAEAAVRELREETGIALTPGEIHQIGAYGHPDRDTRYGRAISVAFLALIPHPDTPLAGSDARGSSFVPYALTQLLGKMEFDHKKIIYDARELALNLLEDTPIATQFCAKNFTMTDLRNVYEAVLDHTVDPANFRKKVESIENFVAPVPNLESTHKGAGRPAQVYKLVNQKPKDRKKLNPPVRFRTK